MDEDDDDDDLDDDFELGKLEDDDDDHTSWRAQTQFSSDGRKSRVQDEDETSANPWHRTGGLRLTRHEYHRFCDAQLECTILFIIHQNF